jgi:hypothetical protein
MRSVLWRSVELSDGFKLEAPLATSHQRACLPDRLQSFRRSASCSISLSRLRLATTFRSLAFLSSSCLSRRILLGKRPSYLRFHEVGRPADPGLTADLRYRRPISTLLENERESSRKTLGPAMVPALPISRQVLVWGSLEAPYDERSLLSNLGAVEFYLQHFAGLLGGGAGAGAEHLAALQKNERPNSWHRLCSTSNSTLRPRDVPRGIVLLTLMAAPRWRY